MIQKETVARSIVLSRIHSGVSMSIRSGPRTAKPAAVNGNRRLLKERAYRHIKQRILNGSFAPAEFLSERQLAGQLAMSKTPVRAALERLESEGLITTSPQQGIIVRDLSVEQIADLYEMRLALETYVARTLAG